MNPGRKRGWWRLGVGDGREAACMCLACMYEGRINIKRRINTNNLQYILQRRKGFFFKHFVNTLIVIELYNFQTNQKWKY